MSAGPRVALRVLRAEGARAVLDRAWDRLLEARRRRSFTSLSSLAGVPAGFRAPVLNLTATPPAPRLGGAQGQLLRRLEAERALRPIALLYPAGPPGGYRLELEHGGERRSAALAGSERSGSLGERGKSAAAGASKAALGGADEELALVRAVVAAARAVGACAVQVDGLAGMPLGALARLRAEGLELIVALHDFAAFCPRPHLLERTDPPRFCHFSRDPERCTTCLRHDWPELDWSFQSHRRQLAGELLRGAAAVVYPSDYLRRAHRELFGGLDPARERVIAPAGAWANESDEQDEHEAVNGPDTQENAHWPQVRHGQQVPPGQDEPPGSQGPLRHAAFVGRVDADKGAEVFAEAVERLAGLAPALHFSVFGGAGDFHLLRRLRRLPGVRVRGYYRDGSLAGRLARAGVELALLLSIVPESYGLALDECARAGMPAAAFAHGALGERVAESGGLLLPPPAGLPLDAAALAALLARLASGEQPLPAPPRRPPGCSPRDAAAAWGRLYAELGLNR